MKRREFFLSSTALLLFPLSKKRLSLKEKLDSLKGTKISIGYKGSKNCYAVEGIIIGYIILDNCISLDYESILSPPIHYMKGWIPGKIKGSFSMSIDKFNKCFKF